MLSAELCNTANSWRNSSHWWFKDSFSDLRVSKSWSGSSFPLWSLAVTCCVIWHCLHRLVRSSVASSSFTARTTSGLDAIFSRATSGSISWSRSSAIFSKLLLSCWVLSFWVTRSPWSVANVSLSMAARLASSRLSCSISWSLAIWASASSSSFANRLLSFSWDAVSLANWSRATSLASTDSRNFASSLCTFWFSLSKLSTFVWLVLHWVRSCGTSWASNFHVSACCVATSFVFSKSSARRWTLSTRHCSLCFSFVILSMVLSRSSIWHLSDCSSWCCLSEFNFKVSIESWSFLFSVKASLNSCSNSEFCWFNLWQFSCSCSTFRDNFFFSFSSSRILLLLSWNDDSLRLSIVDKRRRFSSSNLSARACALLLNCSDKLLSPDPPSTSSVRSLSISHTVLSFNADLVSNWSCAFSSKSSCSFSWFASLSSVKSLTCCLYLIISLSSSSTWSPRFRALCSCSSNISLVSRSTLLSSLSSSVRVL